MAAEVQGRAISAAHCALQGAYWCNMQCSVPLPLAFRSWKLPHEYTNQSCSIVSRGLHAHAALMLPAATYKVGQSLQGIAKTGSGKTAAFVIPMMIHIQDQPELEKGEGPVGVIVAPTRELAEQIHKEARRFGKPFGMRIAAGIGGLSKFEQFKDLKAGSDVRQTSNLAILRLISFHFGCKPAVLSEAHGEIFLSKIAHYMALRLPPLQGWSFAFATSQLQSAYEPLWTLQYRLCMGDNQQLQR